MIFIRIFLQIWSKFGGMLHQARLFTPEQDFWRWEQILKPRKKSTIDEQWLLIELIYAILVR
jgi:hypothetical protein